MQEVALTFACGRYDRTAALMDGRVKPSGVDLHVEIAAPADLFRRQIEDAEFDVAEFSMAHLGMLVALRDSRFTALPTFTSRVFRHSAIYVSSASGITRPEDLVGRKIGVPDYTITAAVYARALLTSEFGVAPESMTWFWGGLHHAIEEPQRLAFRKPDALRLEHIEPGATLDEMLVDGELDAVVSAATPRSFGDGTGRVRRLFPDFRSIEMDYFRRTGVAPIMHCVVVRTSLVKTYPWLARSLYDALCRAKAVAYEDLENLSALSTTLVWQHAALAEERALLGQDHWPYGVAANRPTLEAFVGYLADQSLTDRRVAVEELFAEDLADT